MKSKAKYKLEDLLVLNKFLGGVKFRQLVEHFGSTSAILAACEEELIKFHGIGTLTAQNLTSSRKKFDIGREIALIKKGGVKILTLLDKEYPKILKEIHDPPIALYVKGELLPQDEAAVAVVGTRRASLYGKAAAERISAELTGRGVTITSGLARGIDSAAHRAALARGGRTIAVLGSGLANLYPPENKKLADEIAGSGCVISEFPMETPPDRQNFPRRNRVISGLSWGVVVVEAAEGSGALITADFALEQGREVFAVPGRIDAPVAGGTNDLIKQGAKLVTCADDVIEELQVHLAPYLKEPKSKEAPKPKLAKQEEIVYNILSDSPKHIDQIAEESELPVYKVAGVLMQLAMNRLVKELPGKNFIIR